MKKSYSEKLAEFKELGPFTFVDTIQYHAGDGMDRPRCAACGSNRGYWFMLIKDRHGIGHFISTECRRHIKVQYSLPEKVHHANT